MHEIFSKELHMKFLKKFSRQVPKKLPKSSHPKETAAGILRSITEKFTKKSSKDFIEIAEDIYEKKNVNSFCNKCSKELPKKKNIYI